MQTANPLIGQSVGPYRITGLLGQGGMGVVYRAVHTALEQQVALKAMGSAAAAHPETRQRFLREAQLHARLSHPHIVTLHHFFEVPSGLYFALEFVEGETLAALIRRSGGLTTERCASILSQVLDALAYAHSNGVIHRDIKPSNILLGRDGRAKVTDFGIAKALGKDGMTATGIRPGTLGYMSPEQVLGEPLDARSDLYSLGVTAYEMVTCRVPFDGDSDFTVMRAHVETPPTPPRALREDVDPILEGMILKALAKRPADRFQSAGEWAAALAEKGLIPAGSSGTAAQETRILSAPLEGRRRRRPWILAAAAGALLVGVGGLAVFRGLPSGTPIAEVTSPPPASKLRTSDGMAASPAPAKRTREAAPRPAPAAKGDHPASLDSRIAAALAERGYRGITASADDRGAVTVAGAVESRAARDAVVGTVEGVQGVTRVIPRLTIGSAGESPRTRPAARGDLAPSLPDPSQIADQIQRDLRAKGLHRVQASVDPALRLTLSGSVLDDYEEEAALRLARSHPAIKGLDNRLRVSTRDR